jgi:hypothetical protein
MRDLLIETGSFFLAIVLAMLSGKFLEKRKKVAPATFCG